MTDVIQDPILGELTRLDAFQHGRQVSIEGQEVTVSIETIRGLTPEALTQARRVVAAPEDLARRARRYAADALLELRNEDWLPQDTPPITATELEQSFSVGACDISPDGTATLYMSDGGQFGGHSVLVSLDADGGFWDVKLAG